MVPCPYAGGGRQVRVLHRSPGHSRDSPLNHSFSTPGASAFALLILACTWSTPSAAIGNLGGYRTLGLTYCSEYAQAHAAALGADGTLDRDSGPFAAHAGFVLGYFSAFNAWVVNDIVDITDNAPFEQLFASLADHCREHPDETLAHAIEALVSKLWASRDGSRVGRPPWPPGTVPAE